MIQYILGILSERRKPFARFECVKLLNQSESLLNTIDAIVCNDDESSLSYRWLRDKENEAFGLASISFAEKTSFHFRKPYLVYATTLEEIDRFLKLHNSKISLAKSESESVKYEHI